MDINAFNLNNQIYSNNNNILLGIINELHEIVNSSHENLTIRRISDIISRINFIINENKKNTQLIINHITNLQNQVTQMNKKLDELKIKNLGYTGQQENGLRKLMVRYQVIYDFLRIRTGPSTSYQCVGQYNNGDIINTGGQPFIGEDGKMWVSYTGAQTGATRYVCYDDGSTRYLKEI